MEKAMEIMDKIEALHEKQRENMRSLSRSMLIRSIWPQAFLDHKPVKFGGLLGMKKSPSREQAWIHAWFYGEGKFYFLSPADLAKFKPDAEIHDNYYY